MRLEISSYKTAQLFVEEALSIFSFLIPHFRSHLELNSSICLTGVGVPPHFSLF